MKLIYFFLAAESSMMSSKDNFQATLLIIMSQEQLSTGENQEGKQLLHALSEAMLTKNLIKLRIAVDNLQNALDEKKMCTPMPDHALEELIKTGKETLYVGTGSAGERVYIENGTLSMP